MAIRMGDPAIFSHPVSVDFDGSTEVMRITANMNIGIDGIWTISTWVKARIQAAAGTFFQIKTGVSNNNKIDFSFNDTSGSLVVNLSTSAGAVFKSYIYNNFYMAGTWTNCIATWDGVTLIIYKNGVAQTPDTLTTDNAGTMTSTSRSVSFGANVGITAFANAIIHSCAVWSSVLTASEITIVGGGYDGARIDCRAIQPANLQHWWLLGTSGNLGVDRGFGSPTIDVTASAIGIDSSDVVADAPVSNFRTNFYGHPYCLDLDGSTETLRSSGFCNINAANSWTLMMWLKPGETVFNTNRCLVNFGNGGVGNSVDIRHNGASANDPLNVVILNSAAGTLKNYLWNNLINATQAWQQIVLTWDGVTLTLYSNGSAVAATTKTSDAAGSTSNSLRQITFGSLFAGTLPWAGRFHSTAMWSRGLSAGEVSTIFNNGSALNFNMKSVSGLVHWWLFGTDRIVTDYIDSTQPETDLSLNAAGITLADDRFIDYPGN